MGSEALTKWPHTLGGFQKSVVTLGDFTHTQKQCNAVGEKMGFYVNFDGSAIESISIALGSGGADATTVDLEIQGLDTTTNTNNVSAMPDGTAISNGTASVSNEGGTAGWVTWTFGTAPTPTGPHWVVVIPSGGSFDLKFTYTLDWDDSENSPDGRYRFERLHTTAWSGSVTVGPTPMRVKKTDGSYLYTGRQPYSLISGETANSRSITGTTCAGIKFVAPYDMILKGAGLSCHTGAFHYWEGVLIDANDNELARGGMSYTISSTSSGFLGLGSVALTKGETYRIYLCKPSQASATIKLNTVTFSDVAPLNISAGDWAYTTASDPPSEGGVGGWTDTNTEIPIGWLLACQDLGTLGGDGGAKASVKSF